MFSTVYWLQFAYYFCCKVSKMTDKKTKHNTERYIIEQKTSNCKATNIHRLQSVII